MMKKHRLLAQQHFTIIIIIFLHGLGRLTCSGIDALPSFPGASTISSSSSFVFEGVFRESGVFHSFKVVDPVLFLFESHILYSRDFQFFSYDFASYFVQSCVSRNTSWKAHLFHTLLKKIIWSNMEEKYIRRRFANYDRRLYY